MAEETWRTYFQTVLSPTCEARLEVRGTLTARDLTYLYEVLRVYRHAFRMLEDHDELRTIVEEREGIAEALTERGGENAHG